MTEPSKISFWAKTYSVNGTKLPGICVEQHCLNVSQVAYCLSELYPKILERFNLTSRMVAALAGLHDIGKISPGFACKNIPWLEQNNLLDLATNQNWFDSNIKESNHGAVSHVEIQRYLKSKGVRSKTAMAIATILGGHHGYISRDPTEVSPGKYLVKTKDTKSGIVWEEERLKLADRIVSHYEADLKTLTMTLKSPELPWLGGLTTVADWIGSDTNFFSAENIILSNSDRIAKATSAIETIGFKKPELIHNKSFCSLFGFEPYEMQRVALESIKGPGIYVIEGPMGFGKTEAALGAAYNLIERGINSGIYFALPTQTTSNRMHKRMDSFISRFSKNPNIHSRLIHSNSWLFDEAHLSGSAKEARDWFSSSKRALLATFGVGTVDQLLLGVMATKHYFVRYFALANKVIIIDEVHSYDLYTGTLINTLVNILRDIGCTVIILSATLTRKRLSELINAQVQKTDYPLVTVVEDKDILQIATEGPKPLTIKVDFKKHNELIDIAIDTAKRGGSVMWINNTVKEAQSTYRELSKVFSGQLGLIHSKFPFWRREELEEKWLGMLGKDSRSRCGCILVATQVVEQSVDLDADLLITELAPTDMVLQRIGRLWRHPRTRPVDFPQVYIINDTKKNGSCVTLKNLRTFSGDAISRCLGNKGYVYSKYVLLRSFQVWQSVSEIIVPDQIRDLLEATYDERSDDPKAWIKLRESCVEEETKLTSIALGNTNVWRVQVDDADDWPTTRVNEIPTISVVLCKKFGGGKVVFLDSNKEYSLNSKFDLGLAQAINTNLVKVNKCKSLEGAVKCKEFEEYLYGLHTLGIVQPDGSIEIEGSVGLFWNIDIGVL